MPLFSEKNDAILLRIKAIPGQPVNRMSHIHDDRIVIKVKAPPDKGKANKELASFIAKSLGISRSLVSVIQGQTSHHKLVSLPISCRDTLLTCISPLSKT